MSKLRIKILALVGLAVMFAVNPTLAKKKNEKQIWLFSYFNDNGEDGLHLAYSTDMYTWKALNNDKSLLAPQISNDKLMRDPCIIKGGDGKFHMVWTVSWNEKGIGYASSSDLVSWSEQQYLPVMEHEPTTLNAWAPEITYDAKKKEYMIYWASTIPDRFPMLGVNPKDKYNHRMYYVTTKNFKTFSKTQLLYDKKFSVIDATILKDGKQFVMFLKNENDTPAEKNLRIAFSKKLTGEYSEPTAPITGKYWAEGPTVLRTKDRWIVFFDKYMEGKYGAIESTDLKNWKDISDKISVPKGIRHGTVFSVTEKEFESLKQKLGEK